MKEKQLFDKIMLIMKLESSFHLKFKEALPNIPEANNLVNEICHFFKNLLGDIEIDVKTIENESFAACK